MDVDDGCWRQNVLATDLANRCHQDPYSENNIRKVNEGQPIALWPWFPWFSLVGL